MSIDILPDLTTTQGRSLSDAGREVLKRSYHKGLEEVSATDDLEISYGDILRQQVANIRTDNNQGPMALTSLTGYGVGARRARFSYAHEKDLLWSEISGYAVPDFRVGKSRGYRLAAANRGAQVFELLEDTIKHHQNSGSIQLQTSAGLLGHLVGVHAFDISKRGVPA